MNWRDAEREYDDAVIDTTSLGRLFEDAAEQHPNRPAQRYKGGVYDRSLTDGVLRAAADGDFRAISYAEMRDVVRKLAAGFRDLGVEFGDRIGVFADTRMEWAQTDFALLSAGAVVTTVYRSSSPDQVRYLLDDPEATGVVVENEALLERVLEVEEDLDLEFVVSMDDLSGTYDDRDDVYTLADVYARGEKTFDLEAYQSWVDEPEADDLASLIYTSGTTGRPKGVQLTHGNFRANVNQIRKRYGPRPDKSADLPVIDESVQTVSFLPLAHVFERTAGHFLMFASGACVAYAESPDTLQADFSAVRPNSATSVPRVYEKIYDAIREQASESAIKERIFHWATDVGVEYAEADVPGPALRAKHALADRLVFSQVKEALGGNVELLISGGGSLSKELCTLYHGMGLPIYEGYGLTETAPVVTVNPPEEPKIGTVGPALPDVTLRIDESVADQDVFDDPGQVGELLVRGPNVTEGYWEKPSATDRAFFESEDDGGRWFRTGDIVHLRPDGYVEFRERVKQILVLSTGKNVAPAPIEDAFAASEVVEQCMVVGDGEKFVGALLVPNLEHVREWADREGVDLPEDAEAVCEDERVRSYVGEEVDAVNESFEKHETIKQFRLVPVEFTEDNEMLTPTMKKKRRVILERFDDRVDEVYADA
ncbi:AMP-dependent synthetase/ligase [Natronosalvus rutilus]|uniref:Long-chain fatty acid--CoA ligase n=1 Tax=Natronosalvus rutilus TaxID=2953753 RepID=A0A9E7N917_9EURY|nr:long-chain fatty acid--CoA ligase [Natronosalvus rutilus]UTF53957.1 long-chain fatty acid--CoA ligase [Natronosalvus rutilus]